MNGDPYERLGVTREAVAAVPLIRGELARLLRNLSTVGVKGSVPSSPYYYLSTCDSDEARRVLSKYLSMSKDDRRRLPIEAYCVAAGIPTLTVLDLILGAMYRSNKFSAEALTRALSTPAIVATADIAFNGANDRVRLSALNTIHRATGFLPSPRGAQITVNASALASSSSEARAVAATAPPPEATIRRLSERLNAARGVPSSPLPVAVVVDALPPAPAESPIDAPFAPLAVAVSPNDWNDPDEDSDAN